MFRALGKEPSIRKWKNPEINAGNALLINYL
jgi:hypothetical protein